MKNVFLCQPRSSLTDLAIDERNDQDIHTRGPLKLDKGQPVTHER